MKAYKSLSFYGPYLLLIAVLGLGQTACTSTDEQAEDVISAQENNNDQVSADDAVVEGEEAADAASADEASSEIEGSEQEAVAEDAVASEPLPEAAEEVASEPSEAIADPSVTGLMGKTESAEYDSNEKTPVAVPVSDESNSNQIESEAGKVVRYVRPESLTIHKANDSKSAAMGKLVRGDIVLVTYEGEWARLDNGNFLAARSLSAKGIGKDRAKLIWNSQK